MPEVVIRPEVGVTPETLAAVVAEGSGPGWRSSAGSRTASAPAPAASTAPASACWWHAAAMMWSASVG